MNKEEIIKIFDMKPLENEGGFVKETYKGTSINGVDTYSSILYLMSNNSYSCMHQLETDEIWYFHDGESVELLLIDEKESKVVTLGKHYELGEIPQIRVPAYTYQGARMKNDGEYSLVSTSMAPGYNINQFHLTTYDELKDKTTELGLLKLLTQVVKFE